MWVAADEVWALASGDGVDDGAGAVASVYAGAGSGAGEGVGWIAKLSLVPALREILGGEVDRPPMTNRPTSEPAIPQEAAMSPDVSDVTGMTLHVRDVISSRPQTGPQLHRPHVRSSHDETFSSQ